VNPRGCSKVVFRQARFKLSQVGRKSVPPYLRQFETHPEMTSIHSRQLKQLKQKKMKSDYSFQAIARFFALAVILFFSRTVFAQQAPPTTLDTSKMTYNQISQSMKLYVFPAKGQSKQKQKEDEYECYKWAVEQSGIDPMNPPKVEAAPVQTGPTGGAVKGAAKGAAAGAAIGAIAGDAGKGAAIGATAGAMGGLSKGKQAQAQQNQKAQADAAAKEQAMKDSFKKAFSVCIEGKGYTIK